VGGFDEVLTKRGSSGLFCQRKGANTLQKSGWRIKRELVKKRRVS